MIDQLNITSLFSDNYTVPLYQRAYAWEDREIIQLIHDINDIDIKNDTSYYLGSLIVAKESDSPYEVIDGQQRLTTLYLLLKSLGYTVGEASLSFECRDRSNYTLRHLAALNDETLIEESIKIGKAVIEEELGKLDKLDDFKSKLERVVLFRIRVPQHTDLNRYFEIMNTRGEQLEQHDILKAKLIATLDPQEHSAFAQLWEACSDMTGYVQMHFPTNAREALFGKDWQGCPDESSVAAFFSRSDDSVSDAKAMEEIISPNFNISLTDGTDEKSDRIRFESIIDFPYFLLHVLNVYNGQNAALDDKKLTDGFDGVISQEEFAKKFILLLLRCRFLFDKYIIKREYINDDSEGKWSLKELKQSKKKLYYVNTDLGNKGEWDKTSEARHSRIRMLQACLRVSYTSPKAMHWITELLTFLALNFPVEDWKTYESEIEKIAKKPAKDFIDDKNFNMGVNTPHIVLNYLDYLLWRDTRDDGKQKQKYEDFEFEFRNSVEHWYPRNPTNDSFPQWSTTTAEGKPQVDRFGNLCLLHRTQNSKFSNLDPAAKKTSFEETIKKGSLKLRIMSDSTTLPQAWRDSHCENHENEMLDKLRNA